MPVHKNRYEKSDLLLEDSVSIRKLQQRTTIGIKASTKSRLDKNRAPGQCYDGFLCQLVDTWEEVHKANGR